MHFGRLRNPPPERLDAIREDIPLPREAKVQRSVNQRKMGRWGPMDFGEREERNEDLWRGEDGKFYTSEPQKSERPGRIMTQDGSFTRVNLLQDLGPSEEMFPKDIRTYQCSSMGLQTYRNLWVEGDGDESTICPSNQSSLGETTRSSRSQVPFSDPSLALQKDRKSEREHFSGRAPMEFYDNIPTFDEMKTMARFVVIKCKGISSATLRVDVTLLGFLLKSIVFDFVRFPGIDCASRA